MNKYYFIINPVNKAKANSLEIEIHSFFSYRKDEYQISFSNNSMHLKKLATDAVDQKVDVIIACGGDGTVSEIGQVLINKKIKLGIIPIGSGNGISGHFKIPNNFIKALEVIIGESSKKMDVGKVDNRYFFSNIGFGIEVEFIRHYAQSKTHGLFGYLASFLKSFASYKPPFFDIKVENKNISIKPHVLMITNTNKQGYGVGLYPNAKTDDGILNMIIINKTNIFYLNYLIVLVLLGLSIEKKKNVQYIELKDLKIISKNYYINFQIDGEFEFISKNELDISVIPGGIDILC
jgi:diacylglycerol kinase (ATP)